MGWTSTFDNFGDSGWIEIMFETEVIPLINWKDFTIGRLQVNWLSRLVAFIKSFFNRSGYFEFYIRLCEYVFHLFGISNTFCLRQTCLVFFLYFRTMLTETIWHRKTFIIRGIRTAVVKIDTVCLELVYPILLLFYGLVGVFKNDESKSIFAVFIPCFLHGWISIKSMFTEIGFVFRPTRFELAGSATDIPIVGYNVQYHINAGKVLIHRVSSFLVQFYHMMKGKVCYR